MGLGTLTPQARRFLEAAIVVGLNIIVSGGTQAGKTTLLNCLAGAIPGRERVVTCEAVFELPVGGVAADVERAPSSGCRTCGCSPTGTSPTLRKARPLLRELVRAAAVDP